VAMVLLRYAHQRYTSSGLYGAEVAVPDPGALVLEPLPLDEGAPPPAALPPIPPVTPP
jgi:hypothetical protein